MRSLLDVLKDNRGFLGLGTAIGVGSSLLGGFLGGKEKKPEIMTKQLPEYETSTSARETLSSKLEAFGNSPGYGAIAPDWADIWTMATNKVQDYFYGTPTTLGARDRARASASSRGVSDSPAREAGLDRLSAEEGRMIADLASNEAVNKASFAEQGRQNWLSSMFNMAGMKPATASAVYQPSPTSGPGDLVSSIGGLVGNALTNKGQMDWLTGLLGKSRV